MLKLVMTEIGFLREKSVFERQLAQVHPARREHILRFRLEGDRCRSLAAGLLLRKLFVQLGLDYDRLEVEVESSGRPGIKEWKYRDHHQEYAKISQWYYSVTHSGDYAAVAVADGPIGIDLEAIHRFRNKKSMERRFLTGKEKLLLEKTLAEHDTEENAREGFLPGYGREKRHLQKQMEEDWESIFAGLIRRLKNGSGAGSLWKITG